MGGQRHRSRIVLQNNNHGGLKCGPLLQKEPCRVIPCPINCELSKWTQWGKCSKVCGSGEHTRSRSVTTTAKYNGIGCGSLTQRRYCNTQPCAVVCRVSEWDPFSPCSKTCGGGITT